jgi:hypothetical protein
MWFLPDIVLINNVQIMNLLSTIKAKGGILLCVSADLN